MAHIPDCSAGDLPRSVHDTDVDSHSSFPSGHSPALSTSDTNNGDGKYHHHQQYRPSQPSLLTSNLDQPSSIQHAGTTNGIVSNQDAELNSPTDPDGFYRRYRDSFRTREPNGIYGLNGNQIASGPASDSMASVLPARASHFDRRANDSASASVTVRLNNLTGRPGQDGNVTKKEPAFLPRGRQASVKAFVSRFEQQPDEVISLPGSKPGSRSASANNGSSASFGQRGLRSRTPSRNPAEDRYSGGRRKSGVERIPEQARSSNIQKRTPSKNSTDSGLPNLGKRVAAAHTIPTSTEAATARAASQSHHTSVGMLSSTQMPLFGEIVAGHADFGWGIPAASNLESGAEVPPFGTGFLFRDDTQLDLSPTSPTAWYREPTFEGFNPARMPPRPEQPTIKHKHSRSDLHGLNYTLKPTPSTSPTEPTFASFPQGIAQNGQSRLPVPSGRNELVNHSQVQNDISSPARLFRDAGGNSSTTTPRRPVRNVPLSLNIQSSPSLGAQINDISSPTRSPPLRNSRNRPSLAMASTISSSAKTVERSRTVGSSPSRQSRPKKNIPEMGTVDFAARRDKIQRAISKSVEEKEAEQRRSLILEAQRRKNEVEEVPPVPPMPVVTPHTPQARQENFSEVEQLRRESETLAPTVSGSQDGSYVDVRAALVPPSPVRRGSADDSPTLGTLPRFPPRHESISTTPSDVGSSDSNTNYFDAHPTSIGNADASSTAISAGLGLQSQPESIHVVLGEDQGSSNQSRVSRGTSEVPFESRWSMGSWASSTDSTYRYSTNDVRLESINEVHDGQDAATVQLKSDPETLAPEPGVAGRPTAGNDTESSQTEWTTKPKTPPSRGSSRSNQWMVDQSIVPPRSFSQDTSLVTSPTYVSTATLRPAQSPKSDVTISSPTGLRHREKLQEEKQVVELQIRVDRLSPGGSASPINTKYAQRASLMNPTDFMDASPSIGDWMAAQAQDTPIEETFPSSFTERLEPVQTKKVTGLRPRTPKKTEGPKLPEIRPTEGMLGINISVDSPRDRPKSAVHHNTPEPVQINTSALSKPTTEPLSASAAPSRLSVSPNRGPASRYSTNGQIDASSGTIEPLVGGPVPRSSRSTLNSEGHRNSSTDTRTLASEHSVVLPAKMPTEEEQKAREAEQKRLTRRKNIIKELVDTESSFGQDMTVVVDIYKETSHVILQNPDDVKVLFGNAAEIVAFSTSFLDSLKAAVSSVYKLPRSKRWRTKRDSSATAESSLADETSSITNLELTEDERDRMTSIGSAFDQNLTQMEKIYTDYLKNHEQANARLAELMKSDKVQIWLNECRAYAHDLTSAWSLDSLLVKPVQRILKYPLLLKELADVTPENHPDFVALDSMCREIVGVSHRINAAKKRADLVEQASGNTLKKDRRRKDDRSGFAKAFGRKTEKLKQQVGLSDIVQDKTYNMLADKFGSHFFQVQVVMRDIEMYTIDVKASVQKFESFAIAMEEYMDVAQSPYPEIESKWRMFRLSVRELQNTALTDHVNNVRDHVTQPMKTLLKYYEGPQRMMEKRKKRILDHARWKQIQDAGGKVDRKSVEQAEQFIAINDTLKEELPKLFAKTKQLVEHCLNIFVQLQLQWQTIWRRKLSQAIDTRHLPKDTKDIVESFFGDFRYTEAQVLSLAICNGALKDDDSLQLNHSSTGLSSSATTLNDDEAASRQTSITFDDIISPRQSGQTRSRAASGTGAAPFQGPAYYPAAYAQGPSPRDRAVSNVSGRRAEHHQWGSQGQPNMISPPPSASVVSSNRPSSQSTRGHSAPYGHNPYDPSSYSRYSDDSSRSSSHWYSAWSPTSRNSGSRATESQYGIGAALAGAVGAAGATANPRGSAVFSSALPPSDSTPPSTESSTQPHLRVDSSSDNERYVFQPQPQFNVLFLAASVYEFNIDRARREAGYPYLTYAAGEIFDVIGEKGELWLAKNQDDPANTLGWIWNKHFAKLAADD